MAVIRVTKEFNFEMAHALEKYDGGCRHIHGHSYKLYVTVRGVPKDDSSSPKNGMIIDFGELKKVVNSIIVERFDHSLVLRESDYNSQLYNNIKSHFGKVELVDYQPTCENMISRFAEQIISYLPDGVELYSLKLHETATSYAEWFACDQNC